MTSVAGHVVEGMRLAGIRQLFCIPGVQNDDLFDVLVDARPWLEIIVARHEQGAAYMAMGAAQVTGRPSACSVVPGPGVLNASAALTSACGGGARVLAVVGQIPTWALGRGYRVLHELDDQPAVLAQVTKHVASVRDTAGAVGRVQAALDALVSGTPRPVAIEVPADLWAQDAPGAVAPPVVTMPVPDPAALDRAVDLLAGAQRPLVWVGGGAQDAAPAVRRLAELLQAPVSTRRMGHGVMDADDPLFAPLPLAHDLWAGVDVVLGIGTRLEFPLLQWGRQGVTLVQVNTDAAELDRHRIGAVGLHGDAAAVVPLLVERLEERLAGNPRPDQRAAMADRRAAYAASIAHLQPQLGFLAALAQALPADAVLVEDVTQVTFAAHIAYPFRHPRTFLSTGFAGTLGSAVATAIGAKAAAPDRAVVALTGDGGFLFTATELASAVQHGIASVTVVFDDGAYGNVQRIQRERFGPGRTIASTLVNPDVVAFARSFGCYAERVDGPDGLGAALARALAHGGPAVLHVPVGTMPSPWPFLVMPPVR